MADLLDPGLKNFVSSFPRYRLADATISKIQAEALGREPPLGLEPPDVVRETVRLYCSPAPGCLECLVYRPRDTYGKGCAALVHFHGGGFVLGSARRGDARNLAMVRDLGIVVVSVNYRLAPQCPYPAALVDALRAWDWLVANADTLRVDVARIGVIGESAGGGLAASLVQRLCARGGVTPIAQFLIYPMLDDRTGEEDRAGSDLVWTAAHNRFAWSAYLGGAVADGSSVPARCASLRGLPPSWIAVGALDLFLGEDIAYARRLIADDVATDLQVYSGACHGFITVPEAAVTRRFNGDLKAAILRMTRKP